MSAHHCGDRMLQEVKSKASRGKDKKSKANLVEHPDHSPHIKKLNRIIGQLQGVQRMIAARRYCPDILIQTRAACSAIKVIELSILQTHLQHCVTEATSSSDSSESEKKIDELLDIVSRF